MNAPRIRIALVMLIIAIVALDAGALRAVSGPERTSLLLLALVVLPMANILAGGLLLAIARPRSRPFLGGFTLLGLMAMILVVVGIMMNEYFLLSYLQLSMVIDGALFGPPSPAGPNWLSFGILAIWATWPQLAFAILGGLLSRKVGARPGRQVPA